MKVLTRVQTGVRWALILLALLGLVIFFYLHTKNFQRQLERRVIAALHRATGGRVELDGFHFSMATREAYLRGLTIHGGEAPAEAPLFHADSLIARVKVFSLFRQQFQLRMLRAERPHLHVLTDAQGRTNIPRPLVLDVRRSPLDPIFDLAVERLEMVDGELLWNDRRERLDFDVEDVSASLTHDPARDRYAGLLAGRAARQTFGGSHPFAWSARARFFLFRRRLEVSELALQTSRSQVEASGAVVDFRRPALDLAYDAALDLSELQSVLGLGPFQAGRLTAKGNAHWEVGPAPLRAAGLARLERATLSGLSGVSGSASYEIVRDTAVLSPLRVSLLGGRAEGQMRAEKLWKNPRFTLDGKVYGLSLAALNSALAARDPRVSRLHWAASLSGDTELKFTGMGKNVELSARLTAAAPAVVPPGYTAVSGHMDLQYSEATGLLVARDTLLEAAGTRVTLSGALGGPGYHRAQSLRLSLSAKNAAESASVLDLLNLPVKPQGTVEFQGALWGPLRAPAFDGRVLLGQFVYNGRRFDRFTGNVSYSPERIEIRNGRLESGTASASVTASIPVKSGAFYQTAPLTATIEVRGAELDDLRALADIALPVHGTVTATLTASGTWQDPNVRGYVEVVRGAIDGEPFERMRAGVRSTGRLIEASNLVVTRGAAQVDGSLAYHLDQHSYRFQLTGNKLPLEEFRSLQSPRLALAGTADFRATGSGDGRMHSGQATVKIQNLAVNGELVGNLNADLHTVDDRLEFRAASDFRQAKLDASGALHLREPYPLEGRVEFRDLDLDPFLASAVAGHVTRHSRSEGTATITGNLRHPESLDISAELRRFQMAIENVDVHSEGPLRARYRNQVLYVEQAHLVGADTDLTVSGTAGLAPSGRTANPLALRADGHMNLVLLQTLYPGLLSSGQAALSATLTGSWARPLLNGRVELREARLGLGDFPNTLSQLNGVLLFHNTGLQIDHLTGQSGGGQVRLSGFLNYGQPPYAFELRAEANNVRMRYPPGVSTAFDARLSLAGNRGRSVLSGEVTVNRAALNPNFDLAVALTQLKQRTPERGARSWREALQLDVHLFSSPDIQFVSSRTENLQAEANLRVRGTLADPGLLGRVNILEGQIAFAGNAYTINRGEINFVNPFRPEPVLDLDVGIRKQQYDISMDLIGRLDKLAVTYRSDPPLSVADIQMLLLVGRAPSATAVGPGASLAFTQIGGETILSQALSSASSNRLERFFGGGRLKIDPQVGGPENTGNARLTLEQQVAKDVRFTYITNLTSAQQQIVQVEWAVSPRVSVLAVRDQNGFFGIDLKWKKRFR